MRSPRGRKRAATDPISIALEEQIPKTWKIQPLHDRRRAILSMLRRARRNRCEHVALLLLYELAEIMKAQGDERELRGVNSKINRLAPRHSPAARRQRDLDRMKPSWK